MPPLKRTVVIRRAGFCASISHSDQPPFIDVSVDLRGDDITFTDTVPLVRDFLIAHLQTHKTLEPLVMLIAQLTEATDELQRAVDISSYAPSGPQPDNVTFTPTPTKESLRTMPAADILAALKAAVTRSVGTSASARTLISGFSTRMSAAVAEAMANGATLEELAPITAEVAAMDAETDALAAAVAADGGNGPVDPTPVAP